MKYAVLLRGVNIGGRTVKSDELKKSFAKAGFNNPKTVLATGNIIIESNKSAKDLKTEIEKFLQTDFHFPILVLVISMDDLQTTINNYPFKNIGTEYHRYIIFKDAQTEQPAISTDKNLEAVTTGEHVLYWYVLKGHTLDSLFAKHLAKADRKEFSTTRNINTLEKIMAKM